MDTFIAILVALAIAYLAYAAAQIIVAIRRTRQSSDDAGTSSQSVLKVSILDESGELKEQTVEVDTRSSESIGKFLDQIGPAQQVQDIKVITDQPYHRGTRGRLVHSA